jgi:peptidoglycan/LPS O-acetylase OafA/YrhL
MTDYTKHRFHTLDGMRGVAALMVMLGHSFTHNRTLVPLPLCFWNTFVAVDFFFILSGFVICHAYMDKLKEGMAAAEYVARRIGRLYPLMVIGLLLGAPLFYLNITTAAAGDYPSRDFAVTLLNNLSMLPYLTAKQSALGTFPSDAPLWSVSFEMLASLCFPFLARFDERRLRVFCVSWLVVLVVSAFLHTLTSYNHEVFHMNSGYNADTFLQGFARVFFGFSCGMLLYRLRRDATTKSVSPWLLYIGLIGILLYPLNMKGAFPVFAATVAAPLLVWLGSFSVCRDRFTTRVSECLGWLSYPLYCLHMPVLDATHFLYKKSDVLSSSGVPEQVPAVALSVVVAVLVGLLIDRLQLQRRLTNLLRRGFALVAA